MIQWVEKGGFMTPSFNDIEPLELNDNTVISTLKDLIDLLGKQRGIELYAIIKSWRKNA